MTQTGIDPIDEYCAQVITGEKLVCGLVRKAVERHYRDLEQSENEDYPYYFNKGQANKVINFFGLLKHWKGKWAGTPIILQPFQQFIIGSIFGWLHKETGNRRFREVYEEIPRKNGKTTKVGGVGLFGMDLDNEQGAEVYSAATARDQAKICWNDAKAMVKASPDLQKIMHIRDGVSTISCEVTNSTFRPLSKDYGRLDGLNTHMVINDELHAWPKRDLYDVIDDSTGSREQPLIYNITTAGDNREGICYEIRDYAIKVLNQVVEDERFFAIIYTIDEGDEENWDDPKVWAKANPNLGVSISLEDLEALAKKAKESPAKKNDFLTKRLNCWISSYSSWMNMDWWTKCNKQPKKLEDFEGRPCYMALDLASKLDLASLYLLFKEGDKFYTFGKNYLPESVVRKRVTGHRAVYNGWKEQGLLTLTDGDETDQDYIYEDISELMKRFNVLQIGVDSWQAVGVMQRLKKKRVKVVEIGQTVKNLSEPMKQLEAWAKSGKLEHGNDPILRWAVSNVIAKYDRNDNIFPNKDHRDQKIDPCVTLIMTIALHLVKELPSNNKKRTPKIHVA